MKTITLYKANGSWIARFNELEEKYLKVFGTNEIPTGFTDKADLAKVLAKIKELNPDHDVTII